MENLTTSENVSQDKAKYHTVLIYTLLASIILLSCGGVYYGVMKYMNPLSSTEVLSEQNDEITKVTPDVTPFAPKGNMYLSLSLEGSKEMGIYEFNFERNTLYPYYLPKNGFAFTGEFKDSSSTTLLVSEFSNNNVPQIKEIKNGNPSPLTESDIHMKRHPSYSKALNAIIYGGKDSNAGVLGAPNEFNVYMKTPGGKDVKVGQGAMPALTPDEKSVVVLKSDGLYKLSLVDQSSEQIWKTASDGTAFNQQFSISPKGKYIAWTYPDGRAIYVLEVSSWTPFNAELKYTIKEHAFWPVFSPDEEYIAFEEVDWTSPPSNARLVVMSLNSLEKKGVFDLSSFDQLSLFINEWK